MEFLDSRTNRWLESTQAASITPTAVRITMTPLDGVRMPAIVSLPIIFPMGTLAVGR